MASDRLEEPGSIAKRDFNIVFARASSPMWRLSARIQRAPWGSFLRFRMPEYLSRIHYDMDLAFQEAWSDSRKQ